MIAYLNRNALQDCNATEVDLSDDADVIVSALPCVVLGIYVNTVHSAHVVSLNDGSTTKLTLAASLAAGTNYNFYGARFDTSLVVSVDDSATGKLVIFWVPQ